MSSPTGTGSGRPRLEVEGVTVRYGSVLAVDTVDLAVEAGEVVALLGPSGCGKSSLLAAVAGLVPHGGRILLDGTDVSRLRTDQRDLGLMFQDGALFPHLDVAANVAFGLRMRNWAPERRRDRVNEVLDLVGLSGLGPRRVDELSGGQAQRVALARAIAPQPRLLLLDEPLSSLDRRLRDRLLAELPEVFAAVDAAVVHVTHDQDEALAVADRVAVMEAGRIARLDTPDSLWLDPGSVFVAEFLGWTNLFAVEPGGPRPHLPVPAAVNARGPRTRGDVGPVVGIDPGRIRVAPIAAASPDEPDDHDREGDASGHDRLSTWEGTVRNRRFAGDHVVVEVDLDGHPVVLRAAAAVHDLPHDVDRVTATIPHDAWTWLSA